MKDKHLTPITLTFSNECENAVRECTGYATDKDVVIVGRINDAYPNQIDVKTITLIGDNGAEETITRNDILADIEATF